MSIILKIQESKGNSKFNKTIDYIRFPKFKNFERDSKISFDFPITVLVGSNGSGKSSVLKALYGCISDKQISDYWFSTSIDPILEGDGDSNCFIYNYSIDGKTDDYEVLQIRRKRDKNPDYWETEKPLKKYNMERKSGDPNFRKQKINMNLEYIDFHSLISAFDKYRYFLKGDRILQSNNYLRKKTNLLRNSIENGNIAHSTNVAQNEKPVHLSAYELLEISKILGKTYKSGTIIYHKFFKLWGHSLLIETAFNNKYSEAFAGSGENTVITLVHKIINAKQNSLVLLDEPESCLHPGAQKRLFNFICEQTEKKKLQVIISTHSKYFINELPNNSIKVFNELPNGNIQIKDECSPDTAFFHLGSDVSKKIIYVEDVLCKHLLDKIMDSFSEDLRVQILVEVHPGGETEIKKSIAKYSMFNEDNKFIYFDGDVKIDHSTGNEMVITKIDQIKESEYNSSYLFELVKIITRFDKMDFFSFNSNEKEDVKKERFAKYLKYWESKCHFLPELTPEKLIWNDKVLDNLHIISSEKIDEIKNTTDYKQRFKLLTFELFDDSTSDTIFNTQKIFVKKWIEEANEDFKHISKTLLEIINNG